MGTVVRAEPAIERTPLRILYVIDSLSIGGAERLLVDLVRAGLAEGHRVGVAYFTEGPLAGELRRLSVPLYRISRRGLRDPAVVPRLGRLLGRLRPDVVHTHLRKSDLTGQLAAAWAGVPVRLSTLHNLAPWRRNPLLSLLARTLTSRCQCFIACGRRVRDYTCETTGLPLERTRIVENGVDVRRFDPARVERTVGDAGRTIGIVGRLQPAKGHRHFLEAACLLERRLPGSRFLVVGDGPLRAELEREAARLGLGSRVVFTGLVSDPVPVVGALDLFTLASLSEGLPVALLEAMSLARPVVATAVGGVPDVIADGCNGLLIPPADPAGLARAWERLLTEPGLAERLGAAARRTVLDRFDQRGCHREILDLYASLLAGSRSTAVGARR